MLASAGFPLTKTLLMHGMVLGNDGNKMSKTLGNVVDPIEQLEKYGIDAMRYYLIAGIPTFGDASYREEDLINLVNSHLADSFGNLLSRVIALANKKEVALVDDLSVCSNSIHAMLEEQEKIIATHFDAYDLHSAAAAIHDICMYTNKYMNDVKPWDKESNIEVAKQCLQDLGVVIQTLIRFYGVIMPELATRAQNMIDTMEKGVLFQKIES